MSQPRQRVRTYSRIYLGGWALPILFYMAPITGYWDIDAWSITAVMLVVASGYLAIRIAQLQTVRQPPLVDVAASPSRYLRILMVFAALSLVGGQLVLTEQANFLSGFSFENLQERYIALIASANEGTATHSLGSTIGNLLRSTFFVAVAAYVVYTKIERSVFWRLVATAVILAALGQSFFVNVSRLQFMFYLVFGVVVASLIDHPVLRHKKWILLGGGVAVIFLVVTMDQRLSTTFSDNNVAANAMMGLFGAEMQGLGQYILDHFGLSALILSMYMTQGIPEFVRLVAYNPSPYALGGQSFFLIVSPIARLLGSPLQVDMTLISNQGLWWGLLGDLYLDVGEYYPIAYPIVLYVIVRIARRFDYDGPFALAFRGLTTALLLIVPYTGIFNTFAASYLMLWLFAGLEKAGRRVRAPREIIAGHAQGA